MRVFKTQSRGGILVTAAFTAKGRVKRTTIRGGCSRDVERNGCAIELVPSSRAGSAIPTEFRARPFFTMANVQAAAHWHVGSSGSLLKIERDTFLHMRIAHARRTSILNMRINMNTGENSGNTHTHSTA